MRRQTWNLLFVCCGVFSSCSGSTANDSRLLRREVLTASLEASVSDRSKSETEDEQLEAVAPSGVQDQNWKCAHPYVYTHAAARCQDVGVLDQFEYMYWGGASPCGCACCRRPVKTNWECYANYDVSKNESEYWCQNAGVENGWEYKYHHRVWRHYRSSICNCDCCRRSVEACPGLVRLSHYGDFIAYQQDTDGLMTYKSINESSGDKVTLFYDRAGQQWKMQDKRRAHEFYSETHICVSPRPETDRCPTRAGGGWHCKEVEDDDYNTTVINISQACPHGFQAKGAEDDALKEMGGFIATSIQAQVIHDYRPLFQNSRGNYLYHLKASERWLIGENYRSNLAVVECAVNSSLFTCPGDCPSWKVNSPTAQNVLFEKLVSPAECPTQMYVAGSKLTNMLHRFGLYSKTTEKGVMENMGRPIYKHRNGDYLYYSSETRNWRIGANFNSSLANISSSENEYDFCPHMMSSWTAWLWGKWNFGQYIYVEDANEVCPDDVLVTGHPHSFHYPKFGVFRKTGKSTGALTDEERPIFYCKQSGQSLFYSSVDQAWHIGQIGASSYSLVRSSTYEAQRCPTKATNWWSFYPGNQQWLDFFQIQARPACGDAYKVDASVNVPKQYLGMYHRLTTQLTSHQAGRPLYRNEFGRFLYFWNETGDWHIGPNYNRPWIFRSKLSLVASLKWQNAQCPEQTTRWYSRLSSAKLEMVLLRVADPSLVGPARERFQNPTHTTPKPIDFTGRTEQTGFRSIQSVRRRRQGRVESQLIDFKGGLKSLCLSNVRGLLAANLCHPTSHRAPDQAWTYSSAQRTISLTHSPKQCLTLLYTGYNGGSSYVGTNLCQTPAPKEQLWLLQPLGLIQWQGNDNEQCIMMNSEEFQAGARLILADCDKTSIFQRWH